MATAAPTLPTIDINGHPFAVETSTALDRMPTSSWTWPPVVPRIDPTQQPLREGTDLAGNPSSRFA